MNIERINGIRSKNKMKDLSINELDFSFIDISTSNSFFEKILSKAIEL